MTTTFMEKVLTNGLMEDNMMESGLKTRCTDMESSYGKMDENMKVNTKMTRKKDKELSLGQMAENTLETGI
jgi:hypothetical protein